MANETYKVDLAVERRPAATITIERTPGEKIELTTVDTDDNISEFYLESDEADSVAVALIQATPATEADQQAAKLHCTGMAGPVAIGLALIRSARKP